MTLCMSQSTTTTSVTNLFTTQSNVIQLVDMLATESNHLFKAKILCFSSRNHHMNSHHRKTCSLSLLNQMQIRVPRTLSFASPNGKGEAESCNRLEAISGDKASTECT
uniref:Plastidial pyruvate kinase 4, chloroplastic n=1 Tax=Noccaea caerulescens TaxID=107243 RepID=A0A1J3FRG5_NOCCA